MSYKRALLVLVGLETASRRGVQYEIERAWDLKRSLFGIYIHGLSSMGSGTDRKRVGPFRKLSISGIPAFGPTITDWRGAIDTQAIHRVVRNNLERWTEQDSVRT